MSKFTDYMEAADLYKRMSPEDFREVQKHKAEIAHLKRSGDDSVIKQEIRYEYGRIKAIENKYRTDEEKQKVKDSKAAAGARSFKKSADARQVKSSAALEKYNALSDIDKAKEAIIGVRNARMMSAKERNVIIDDILKAFDIKGRPYTFKSKFSLSEKANMTAMSIRHRKEAGLKVPEKLVEVMEKHDTFYMV
jgi:hypothetical protein